MSPARYAPLPNPRTTDDAEAEMHAAFELDDDDEDTHSESAPLTKAYRQPESQPNEHPQLSVSTSGPATYDFERDYDYDYPPPGSPPPNAIGNSNGVLPSTPVHPPTHNRPTFFRRVVGALLPQHYQAVPTEPTSQRAVGGGQDNDGVFANVMAKPGRAVQVQAEDGSVYMVPEETQGQAPPSYSEAQADAVPQYWETTVHAPSSLDPSADMIVDDLPTGSWYLFAANVFISWFFQFIGFLFTYLLHTTHAAKYGSRVGLGITLIQFGFYSRRPLPDDVGDVVNMSPWNNSTSNSSSIGHGRLGTTILPNGTVVEVDMEAYDLTSRDWVAFLLMTLGWFLLLSSLAGFFRVKRWERSIRSAAPRPAERASETPQVLTQAYPSLFGSFGIEHEQDVRDESQMSEAELRLARDLRAAGLI